MKTDPMTRKWKLVPAKYDAGNGVVRAGMTDAMHDAFWKRFEEASQKHGDWEATNAAYNAMLSASPAPGEDVVERVAFMLFCKVNPNHMADELRPVWRRMAESQHDLYKHHCETARAVLKALEG